MSSAPPVAIAVISDAHLHDPTVDFGWPGAAETGGLSLRPLSEAARSTRVFNETKAAFLAALDEIVRRGIRHVVLLGDYTDDGQVATTARIAEILTRYRRAHGLRFYLTPGNHDVFADRGRHRTKRFLRADGSLEIVTSDPDRTGGGLPVTRSPAMYCPGQPEGLLALRAHGYFGADGAYHWETPFGTQSDPLARRYSVRSRSGQTVRTLMDASYLVEPEAGLWLLMIDANVFVPVDGGDAFEDSTAAGWTALVAHKAFLVDWIAEVTARADRLGKRLVAFSHYPLLDPLDGTRDDEAALLGPTETTGRLPRPEIGAALMAAGLRLHVSGHIHVNDTARMRDQERFLVNLAVPSLGGFPAAIKILSVHEAEVAVETVTFDDLPLDPGIMALYQAEARHAGLNGSALLTARDYGDFLSAHIGHIAWRRHLKREWPAPLAALLRIAHLGDLFRLASLPHDLPLEEAVSAVQQLRERAQAGEEDAALTPADDPALLEGISGIALLGDWYRLRMGSGLGLRRVGPERLALYRRLAGALRQRAHGAGSAQATLRQMFDLLERFADGLPSENFSLDMRTGKIRAL
ncbi:metallophosphoesterase family protein [Rhizobium sp. YIM 134829]|uniref:metallophosphoesterase family protein n=1 Tax=Rhizobium sp. YIM 134829 TaxID=3390453 RepID=UPI00397B224A